MRKIYQMRIIFAGTEASIQNRVNKFLFKLPEGVNLVKTDFGYMDKKHFAYITTSLEVEPELTYLEFKDKMHDCFQGDNNENY